MSRCRKDSLRPLTADERQALEHIARSGHERADVVARTKEVLAVAAGSAYGEAAIAAGRRSSQAVSMLVTRFNQEGLAAVQPRGGGGRKPSDDAVARERILTEARRTPDPQRDGTATWSLMTLRRALREAPEAVVACEHLYDWPGIARGGLSLVSCAQLV
jgi:transposase